MKREAVLSILASEGLVMVSVSARTASSVVVVPTPMDPMEFRKSTRDLKAQSAAKEHSNELVGETDHNVGGLACILRLTHPHN